jgi:hypothetical protein
MTSNSNNYSCSWAFESFSYCIPLNIIYCNLWVFFSKVVIKWIGEHLWCYIHVKQSHILLFGFSMNNDFSFFLCYMGEPFMVVANHLKYKANYTSALLTFDQLLPFNPKHSHPSQRACFQPHFSMMDNVSTLMVFLFKLSSLLHPLWRCLLIFIFKIFLNLKHA